ncbi:MAG: hypothetical protein OK474_02190 [Thaumarchaeota archaeon]|nr:hypothetical protein [Nitrososphaerota archaeon]
MPRSKEKPKTHTGTEEVLDSFESWLQRQKPKAAKARPGFTSGEPEQAETS